MASSSDSVQAANLSRTLRKAGWNPVGADSPRRFEAGLTVRRGSSGLGASVCLSSESTRTLEVWAADMAQTLDSLGYVYDRSEPSDGSVWFRRVKKAETII